MNAISRNDITRSGSVWVKRLHFRKKPDLDTLFIRLCLMLEKLEDRFQLVIDPITPVINSIVRNAMKVAIGTWPTPERPQR